MILTSPTVLRFTVSDVMTAYVSLVFGSKEDPLMVENVTVFGPRERVCFHSNHSGVTFSDQLLAWRCWLTIIVI